MMAPIKGGTAAERAEDEMRDAIKRLVFERNRYRRDEDEIPADVRHAIDDVIEAWTRCGREGAA